jgi:putative spermidine/putrescine transport system permease protein
MSLAEPLGHAGSAPDRTAPAKKRLAMPPALVSWLQIGPLALILLVMFVLPLGFVVVVSFFDYGRVEIYPAFMLDNYAEIFTSPVTLRLYLKTLKFAAIVEAITLVLGFFVAYYISFHIRTLRWRIVLLLACTIPFFTSNMIRMISWIPFLGRNGILNGALMSTGLVHQPLDFLLFSDFAVVVAYVHIFTLFMVAPIVNSMAKIDRSLIAAARDAGASEWQIVRDIIIPLSKTGIALGSVLVLTQVMGDFFIMSVLSGGQSAGVVSGISTELTAFEYPPAAASSVVLLAVVIVVVVGIFRLVDVRRELAG